MVIPARIALVTDDPVTADALRLLLQDWGFQSSSTLRLTTTEPEIGGLIDALVVDLKSFDLSTQSLIAKALSAAQGKPLPAVLLVSEPVSKLDDVNYAALEKPVDPERIREALLRLLKRNPRSNSDGTDRN